MVGSHVSSSHQHLMGISVSNRAQVRPGRALPQAIDAFVAAAGEACARGCAGEACTSIIQRGNETKNLHKKVKHEGNCVDQLLPTVGEGYYKYKRPYLDNLIGCLLLVEVSDQFVTH